MAAKWPHSLLNLHPDRLSTCHGCKMQTLHAGYRGLSLLFGLNWDGLLYLGTVLLSLLVGALVGTWVLGL